MVKKIILGLMGAIALLLIFAATRPDSFRVERSLSIKAEPTKAYALLNDFQHFPSWSLWQSLDPAMKTTHSGAPSGPGAVYEWKGNDAVGAGRMEILKTVVSAGGMTTVTWAMFGPSPYISKLMGVFVSMDSMIGKDFERGLANLKSVAEK